MLHIEGPCDDVIDGFPTIDGEVDIVAESPHDEARHLAIDLIVIGDQDREWRLLRPAPFRHYLRTRFLQYPSSQCAKDRIEQP